MKAIVMKRPGGPETLDAVDRPEPVLGTGQALVEVASAGMNFMDISPALYMPARVVQVGAYATLQVERNHRDKDATP